MNSPRFRRLSLANTIVNRPVIGAVNLVALLVFFGAQILFALFLALPPRSVFLLCGVGCAARVAEILYFLRHKEPSRKLVRGLARVSILWTLALALAMAIFTHQPDTHYFGLLILPILEAAIYFSFTSTLVVATTSALVSLFWVAYVGHFTPPFSPGEVLESSTLVLVYFIVGSLVWLLVRLLRSREEELRERLNDLEATRNQLIQEEKLSAIGRLASAVAHEIRNPVAIITSSLETAASPRATPLLRDEMSKIANLEAKRLERLTTDFLTYAQPSKAPFRELDISALVGYICSIVRAKSMQKQLSILAPESDPIHVQGNEGQLQQVLLNLVRNAIEASPEGSAIRVDVQTEGSGRVKITVENRGEPISGTITEKIFEPFFTAKEGGTGLGLAIARSIVERHKGELQLERNETDHIVFAVTLPLSQA